MIIVIILLALVLFAYAAAPLIFTKQHDPLPSYRDPDLQELEEERDALFRAIRELELRDDLPLTRREELRARYEAKAAKILRALDERQQKLKQATVAKPKPTGKTRRPYAVLSLLAIMVIMSVVLSQYLLPRVGPGSMITTFFEDELRVAEAVRDLQRAVNRDPSLENLLALGDAYWQLGDPEGAEAIYMRITQDINPAPAEAFRRLGYLKLQSDLAAALPYLEQARAADPGDLDTLYALGEVYFAQAQPDEAIEAFEAFLEQPEGRADPEVIVRLETVRAVAGVLNAASADPNEATLSALADAYWRQDELERAADIYLNVLSSFNPHNEVALSRLGQVLFFSGRNDQAIGLLEQARQINEANLDTLLFLGNAYFSLGQYAEAVQAWEQYVEVAGGEVQAGRVPDLLASARARQAEAALQQVVGSPENLYAQHCALCHGVQGQGGSGPRLAGNARAANRSNVLNITQYGRGMMPGYIAILEAEQLNSLVDYVVDVIAGEASSGQ